MKYEVRIVLKGVIEAENASEAVNATNIDAGELTVHEIECEPQTRGGGVMAVMRVRYTKRGGHYHCRVFTAKQANFTFANCGELVFDEAEWESVREMMAGAEFVADKQ